ncbi:hypothetical protein ACLOJK_035932 [Asimina triloba]
MTHGNAMEHLQARDTVSVSISVSSFQPADEDDLPRLPPRDTALDPDKALNGWETEGALEAAVGGRVFKQRQQMGGFEGGRNSPAFPTEEDRRKAARAIALAGRPGGRSFAKQGANLGPWSGGGRRCCPSGDSGLVQLRQEVKASKYKDVHVMWEILRKSESEVNDGSPGRRRRRRKRPFWRAVMGASRMPYPSRCY